MRHPLTPLSPTLSLYDHDHRQPRFPFILVPQLNNTYRSCYRPFTAQTLFALGSHLYILLQCFDIIRPPLLDCQQYQQQQHRRHTMPFRFGYLCDLLSSLEAHQTHDPPYLPARLKDEYRKTIEQWFRCHRARIDSSNTDCVALLSALFPERRTDRVYRLKGPSLVRIFGRCLSLGATRAKELNGWRERGGGDLGDCV